MAESDGVFYGEILGPDLGGPADAVYDHGRAMSQSLLRTEKVPVPLPASRAASNSGVEHYLDSLGTEESRRSVKSALNTIALLCGYETYQQLDWSTMTVHHIQKMGVILSLTAEQIDRLISEDPSARQAFEYFAAYRRRAKPNWQWKPISLSAHRRMVSVCKGVARSVYLFGGMEDRQYNLIQNIKNPQGRRVRRRKLAFSADDVVALLQELSAQGTATGARDAAVLGLLYGCGLRRDEVRTLTLKDVDLGAGKVYCIGKRNKEREIPLLDGVALLLKNWMLWRGDTPGAFILQINKSDNIKRELNGLGELKHGSQNFIYRIVKKVFERRGMTSVAPHDLRRAFATSLINNDAGIGDVASLLGHANIETTRIYTLEDEERLRRAIRKLDGIGETVDLVS